MYTIVIHVAELIAFLTIGLAGAYYSAKASNEEEQERIEKEVERRLKDKEHGRE